MTENEDGRPERRDDSSLVEAIDQLFEKDEETIDDLVKSFQYFTNIEVTAMNGTCDGINGMNSQKSQNNRQRETSEPLDNVHIESLSDAESLQEEELGSGITLLPPLDRPNEASTGIFTKFDNFMEDDLSDLSSMSDDDDLIKEEGSGYTPDCHCEVNSPGDKDNEAKLASILNNSVYEASTTIAPPLPDVFTSAYGVTRNTAIPHEDDSSFQVTYLNTVLETDPLPGEAVEDNFKDIKADSVISSMNCNLESAFIESLKELDNTNNVCNERSETQVESFQLDENFDYDNVQCTPKFDMELLKRRKFTLNE